MEYNLVDIYFHTNLSYGGYENQNGIKYDINDFVDKEYEATDIISLLDKYGINYTSIPHLDKDKGIFKLYKQVGNSVAVPVIERNANNIINAMETN